MFHDYVSLQEGRKQPKPPPGAGFNDFFYKFSPRLLEVNLIQIHDRAYFWTQMGWRIKHQAKNSKIAELGNKNTRFILLDQGSDVSSLSMISFSSVAVTEMLGWWVELDGSTWTPKMRQIGKEYLLQAILCLAC